MAAVACVTAVLVVQPWKQVAPPADAGVSAQPSDPATTPPVAYPTNVTEPSATGGPGELDRSVAVDHDSAEQLVGYCVPQISSKELGTNPDGRYFGDTDVVADHLAWAARFPDVVLLRSGDYSSFGTPRYWVTVVAQPFGTAAQANAWCDAQDLGPGDCFAKMLSHTASPSGSTVHR